KLQWFSDHKCTPEEIQQVCDVVVKHWKESYNSSDKDQRPAWTVNASKKHVSKYAPVQSEVLEPDNIETYLLEPPVKTELIANFGGYMKYWHSATSSTLMLAKMGSDFCSAPGK
ncbi:hypothetical protein BDQ12DRAFT_607107, partial [Crucibulum laeve]